MTTIPDELWHEVIVEIPTGSRNKYEVSAETGEVWLDRHLFQSTVYPTEYGFFPNTLAADGDPLDALVIVSAPTYPGVHLRARPIGLLQMVDEAGDDVKILCVLAGDPRWAHLQDIDDVPEYLLDEIQHFFTVYKDLEPNKESEVGTWDNRDVAEAAIIEATAAFKPVE